MEKGNNSKKHRINAVDVIIILLITVVIAAAAVIFIGGGGIDGLTGNQLVDFEYVIEFRQLREEFTDNIVPGQQLVDAAEKKRLGESMAVNISPSVITNTDMENGKLVYANHPDYYDVDVIVKAKALINDEGEVFIDGTYRLTVGGLIYVQMPNFTGSAYCTEMIIAEDNK